MHPTEAARARRAATAVARSFGLTADVVVDLHDSNRLTVRLLPCDLVARIGPAGGNGARDEVERALRLASVGAPVGRLDPRVPDQVHVHDDLEITLWAHHAPRTDRDLPPAEYAAALADLHAAMRNAGLEVPSFTSRVEAALALLEDPGRTPRLSEEEREFLRETLTSLAERIARSDAQQPLHGEPHPGNVLDAEGGPVLIDLETCCTGPVEFDLAHAPAEVAEHYPGVDPALLEDCLILTRALATTWRWDREDSLPRGELLGLAWLDQVRALVTRRRGGTAELARPAQPTLTILCGLPGSGKTTAATRIIEATGALRLGADDWLTRLGRSLWDEELRDRIEPLQWQSGREMLAQGVSVVVEWGTWGREERDRLREEARELGARAELHVLDADDEELWRRISARGAEDPPTTREQITRYRATFEAPTAEELALYDDASGTATDLS